jgi:hypothetical protein
LFVGLAAVTASRRGIGSRHARDEGRRGRGVRSAAISAVASAAAIAVAAPAAVSTDRLGRITASGYRLPVSANCGIRANPARAHHHEASDAAPVINARAKIEP